MYIITSVMIKKNVRLTENMEEQIQHLIYSNPDKYQSEAHFIRCAVIKLLEEENAVTITNKSIT